MSGNWSTAGNWTPAIVPTSATATSIAATGSNYTVTLNTTGQVATFTMDSANATFFDNGQYLELFQTSGTSSLTLGTLQLSNNAYIYSEAGVGGHTLLNSATIQSTAGTNGIYGSGNGLSLINSGTVSVTAGTLNLGAGAGDTVQNASGGVISANGATAVLNLEGSGTSIDNLTGSTLQAINGGTINIGGHFTLADLGGNINGTGGTINITGTLNNAGTLTAPNGGGIYTLDGGTILGGVVSTNSLAFVPAGGSTLDDVNLNGSFTVPSGTDIYANSGTQFTGGTTTFTNGYLILNGAGTAATVASGAALTGNFTIYAQAANLGFVNNGTITNTSGSNNFYGDGYSGFTFTNFGTVSATSGQLIIGNAGTDAVINNPGGTIEANGGNVYVGYNSGTVANAGTLEAIGSSSTLTLGTGPTTWTNTGSIIATAGGTVDLGGSFHTSDLSTGAINGTGGAVNITGALDNSSGPLTQPFWGAYTLNGGTITGGIVESGAITFGTAGGSTLDDVTMNGNFSVPSGADIYSNNGTQFTGGTTTFTNGYLILNGAGTAATVASGAALTGNFTIYAQAANLGFVNNGTITNTSGSNNFYGDGYSGFTFTNFGTVSATSGQLIIGNAGTDAVINNPGGTIEANGGNVYVGYNSGTVANAGLIEATGSSSTLTLGNGTTTWTNTGSIVAAAGGTIDLGGIFSSTSLSGGGINVNATGGSIYITGTLNNSGAPLAPPNLGGIFTLGGGTINGGTVSGTNGALTFSSTGGALNDVAMAGDFNVPANANFTVENGTSFNGNLTLAGNNTINLAGTTPSVLTISPSLTWTDSGALNMYAYANGLTFLNQGTMDLAGGTFGGNYNTGFVLNNAGTVTNTNGSLTIANYPGDTLTNSGAITGLASGGSFSSVNLANGSSSVVTNSGQIEASSTGTNSSTLYVGNGSSASVTNTGTIEASVTGSSSATVQIGDGNTTTVANTGTLEATGPNSSLTLGYYASSSTWTNVGGAIIAASGGVVDLGGTFTNATLTSGTIDGAGGTLNLIGTLNNTGTLAPPNTGIFTLDGGTINGGTVSGTNGALTFSSTGGALNDVAMAGDFNVPANANFTVENGTSFNGNLTLAGNNTINLAGTTPSVLTISPSLTWTDSGALNMYAYANGLTFLNQGTMDLAGGTFGGNYNTGFVLNNAGTVTNTNGSLTIANYPGDTLTNSGAITGLASGGSYSSVNLGNGSNSTVANSGQIEASSTGTNSSSLYVGNGSSASVTNTGTIEASVTGSSSATVQIGDGNTTTVANTGTLEATGPNSSLTLGYYASSSTWTNVGGAIIAASGGVVDLGGTFTNATLTSGTIDGAGGTLNLIGTLNNTGTLAPPNTGIFTLAGGTINGGTVSGANGALTFGNLGGTLNDVAMSGNFSVPANAYFEVENGTSFNGNLTLAGNNTINLAGTTPAVLTISPSLTWTDSGTLSLYAYANGLTFLNQGTMDLAGGIFGGNYYTGFVVDNSGTITNTNGSLTITNYPGDTLTNSGTITGLASGGSYSSVNLGNGSNSVVTNSGQIEASSTGTNSSTLYVGNGTSALVTNTGTIEASSTGSSSATVQIGDGSATAVANTGTLEATGPNSSLTLGYYASSSTWTNAGGAIIAAVNGVVNLGGTFSNLTLTNGTIDGAGGTLNLIGTLNNTGTLAPPNTGIFTLAGGTINGGTVSGANGALTFGNLGGTLNDVAMTGNFNVPANAYFEVENGTSFNGNITLAGSNTINLAGTTPAVLTVGPGLTWTDSGYLSMYAYANGLTVLNQGTMTLTGGTFGGNYYTGFVVDNSGTIINGNSSLSIGNYPGDTVTNTGTIEQNGSGTTLLSNSTSQVTNLASNTLTGGTWIARGGGSIYFEDTSNTIVTNAAGTTIVLDGSGSNIRSGTSNLSLDQTLTTNNGTLEVLTNRNFAASNGIVNNGTIQLGGGTFSAPSLTNSPGSTLSGSGTFAPAAGGVTVGSGVLVSPGSASAGNYVGAMTFNTATLGQGGEGMFDVENASGTPGVGYDSVTVTGALTVSATPGSPFAISLESINPGSGTPGAATFNMNQSYQWTLLAAGSVTGFSPSDFTLNTSQFTNGVGSGVFSLSGTGTDIYLNFTPVPEPSTWALIGTGLAALHLASRHRRRAAALRRV